MISFWNSHWVLAKRVASCRGVQQSYTTCVCGNSDAKIFFQFLVCPLVVICLTHKKCVIVYRIRIGITFEIGISSLQNNSAVWLSLQSYSGNLSPSSMLIHCRCYATCLTKIEAQPVSYQCPFTHPVHIKFMWWTTTLVICLNYIYPLQLFLAYPYI